MLQKLSRIVGAVVLLGSGINGYAANEVATQALQCKQFTQCRYFADLYAKDPEFQQAIKQAFTEQKMPLPAWIDHSTSVPMVPVLIKGASFLLGLGGEQHNMPHQAAFLYEPSTNRIAIRYVDQHEKVHFLGADNAVYVDVLKQYVDPTSALSQIVTSDYATLPIILNPYLE